MGKKNSPYICKDCEAPHYKFQPKCFGCGGDIIENEVKPKANSVNSRYESMRSDNDKAELVGQVKHSGNNYYSLGVPELDEFFGDGKGIQGNAFYLLYGDPGAGKSTLLAGLSKVVSDKEDIVLYNSGEESKSQVDDRTKRIIQKDSSKYLYLSSHKNVQDILEEVNKINPKVLIIDSIQTIHSLENNGVRGGVSQVREVTDILKDYAKANNLIIFVIAHVNSEGDLAGPTTLEHMVDGVFFLENTNYNGYRRLISKKNRYGITDTTIIWKMTKYGMVSVPNASEVFLKERGDNTVGSSIIPILEGNSSVLLELQALTKESDFNGHPMRNVTGFNRNRLVTLLAIIEKHLNVSLGMNDVYINIVGGFKSDDYSLDLGVIKALLSSYYNKPIGEKIAYIGEVGLSGEVRSIPMIETRIKECKKMGITDLYLPYHNKSDLEKEDTGDMRLHYIKKIIEVV